MTETCQDQTNRDANGSPRGRRSLNPQHAVAGAIVSAVLLLLVACGAESERALESSAPAEAGTTAPEADESTATSAATPPPPEADVSDATRPPPEPTPTAEPSLRQFEWTQQTPEAPWSKRAGLRVVELGDVILMMGGRTPNDSTIPGDSQIFSDVWATSDFGVTWTQLQTEGDIWAPRAYFQVARKGGEVFVLGGQDYGLEPNPFCALFEQGLEPPPGLGIDPDAPCPEFFPTSQFFNDVWKSTDGVDWEEMTEAAPWAGRAGLSAEVLGEHIYVLGGSQNDDSAIIGVGGPQREYFNDVWRSTDGADWELITEAAPWAPRAGGGACFSPAAMRCTCSAAKTASRVSRYPTVSRRTSTTCGGRSTVKRGSG